MTVIGILFGKDKLLGTCVRYLRSVETSIGARGPDFLGGSATHFWHTNPFTKSHCSLIIHMESWCFTNHYTLSNVLDPFVIQLSLTNFLFQSGFYL